MSGHEAGIKNVSDTTRTIFVNRHKNILENETRKPFLYWIKQPYRILSLIVVHCDQTEERNANYAQSLQSSTSVPKRNAREQGVSQILPANVSRYSRRMTTNNPDHISTCMENKVICEHTGNGQKNNQKITQMLRHFHTSTRAKAPHRITNPHLTGSRIHTAHQKYDQATPKVQHTGHYNPQKSRKTI
jgi:hypothetical protein